MKFKDLKELTKFWKKEDVANMISSISKKPCWFKKTDIHAHQKWQKWIEENIVFLNENELKEIDFSVDVLSLTKPKEIFLNKFLAAANNYDLKNIQEFLIKNNWQKDILNSIITAKYLRGENVYSYYESVQKLINNNILDFNQKENKEIALKFSKISCTEHNKKNYSDLLFNFANYFYINKNNLENHFVLEIVDNYLSTGKFIKSNLKTTLEMSNWRESVLSIENEEINCKTIIKKINPVKYTNTAKELTSFNYILGRLELFLKEKFTSNDNFLMLNLSEKSSDKVFVITYEKDDVLVNSVSEMIDIFKKEKFEITQFQEIWDKISLKNKIEENLYIKNINLKVNKI